MQPPRAQEVSARRGEHPADFASDNRRKLLRDARRAWMSTASNQKPHSIMILSLRLAQIPAGDAPAAAAHLLRTGRGLRQAIETLGPVYDLTSCVYAVIVREHALQQVLRVAEAIGAAIDRRSAENRRAPLLFAAGVAALHREDDPVTAVCLAETCLQTAERSEGSRIVSECAAQMRCRRDEHCFRSGHIDPIDETSSARANPVEPIMRAEGLLSRSDAALADDLKWSAWTVPRS